MTTPLKRAHAFVLSIAAVFLLPLAIPGVGLNYEFFFVMVFALSAWFVFRWDSVKQITQRSGKAEILLGASLIAADYAFNAFRGSSVGMLDLLAIFLGTVIASFGLGSLKFFWVPATYGIILILGENIEYIIPNYLALQEWLAGVMASSLSALGIGSTVSGNVVSMATPNGAPLLLEVSGGCTGVQGILAFGALSTMTLLDLKPKLSRMIPIFAIGFLGAFLINVVRLLVVFLSYEYAGADVGAAMHQYLGYLIFILWVVAFWALAFRYLSPVQGSMSQRVVGITPSPSDRDGAPLSEVPQGVLHASAPLRVGSNPSNGQTFLNARRQSLRDSGCILVPRLLCGLPLFEPRLEFLLGVFQGLDIHPCIKLS